MLRQFQVIKDPAEFRIINLLRLKRLSCADLQKILEIPLQEIHLHINHLYQLGIISCDLNAPLTLCRLNDSFIEQNLLFYEMALIQMNKLPVYQNDLVKLQHFKND